MKIRNHIINDIWYKQTSNVSKKFIDPTHVVLHYTASWTASGSLSHLLGRAGGSSNTGSSAHLVVDRDGSAWQICPFNRRAWHAGPSEYNGFKDLNSHSIGIEFVNPGWLKKHPTGWVDSFGSQKTETELEALGGYMLAKHPRVGGDTYAWLYYTEAQILKGIELCELLMEEYDIKAFVTHEEIDTRGWKTDPGPAFPLDMFTDLLNEKCE